jgi:hypothetical protein
MHTDEQYIIRDSKFTVSKMLATKQNESEFDYAFTNTTGYKLCSRGRRNRMVVRFTTTYAISTHHH